MIAVVNGGLNRQQDFITYEYTEPTSKIELSDTEEEMDEENVKNKENNLPSYVPPYFPPFPVMIAPEESEESVMIETKAQQLPAQLNDALPLPNIVKKKNRPVDNPFTFLKPFDESMLSIKESDQPEALSLSMKISENRQLSKIIVDNGDDDDEQTSTGHVSKKRRRSETLSQLIDQLQSHDSEAAESLTDEIKLFNEGTTEGAAPGNTMFSVELGLLDKLMTGNAPPIAIPKLTAPNLLMDIVVPQGPAATTSSSSTTTTLRLNMSPTNSRRKPSLGGMTIEESTTATPAEAPSTTEISSPTTIKIAPISLAALSSPTTESKKPAAKKTKEKKKPKATKSKKKLTISLPTTKKPQSDSILILANSPQEPTTTGEEDPSSSTTVISAQESTTTTTPVIRFTIKPPAAAEQKAETSPLQSPKTTDVIRCICENSTVDDGTFMVACDTCGVWFHGQCVGIAESDQVEEWHCSNCVTKK